MNNKIKQTIKKISFPIPLIYSHSYSTNSSNKMFKNRPSVFSRPLPFQIAFLLLLFVLLPTSNPLLQIQPEQIQLNRPSLLESNAASTIRRDWLRQKVCPDLDWQRKMELLLGRTNLIKSAEQESIQEAQRNLITARKGGPNDTFRATIKQILLGIH